mgnify:CR=1
LRFRNITKDSVVEASSWPLPDRTIVVVPQALEVWVAKCPHQVHFECWARCSAQNRTAGDYSHHLYHPYL